MSQYTDKAMELADAYAGTLGDWKQNRETLRQHIEAGKPDCRTCENNCGIDCNLKYLKKEFQCINFSQYKRADYKPLCEE